MSQVIYDFAAQKKTENQGRTFRYRIDKEGALELEHAKEKITRTLHYIHYLLH